MTDNAEQNENENEFDDDKVRKMPHLEGKDEWAYPDSN